GRTEREAQSRLHQIRGYLNTTPIVDPGFRNPPGYVSPVLNASGLVQGHLTRLNADFLKVRLPNGDTIDQRQASGEQLVENRIAFAGTPDQVVAQIKAFH